MVAVIITIIACFSFDFAVYIILHGLEKILKKPEQKVIETTVIKPMPVKQEPEQKPEEAKPGVASENETAALFDLLADPGKILEEAYNDETRRDNPEI